MLYINKNNLFSEKNSYLILNVYKIYLDQW